MKFGIKKVIFAGTNGLPRTLFLFAGVANGEIDRTKTSLDASVYCDWTTLSPVAGTTFDFALGTPGEGLAYYVICEFHDDGFSSTRRGRFQEACQNILLRLHMRRLAKHFEGVVHTLYIPSTEIKE
jgi:hypothetical protein